MNKKILLIIICIVALGLIVYILATKNKGQTETSTTQNPVINFNNQGDRVRYNADEDTVELYDSQTDSYKKIAYVGTQPAYSEISPDKKYLLYTNAVSDSHDDEENLTVVDIAAEAETLTKEKVYSPHFTADGKIIYQSIGDKSSTLNILTVAGKSQSFPLPSADPFVIEPINENYVIIYEFSFDVSQANSYVVNTSNGASTKFISGEGLKIKSVLNSQYVGVQTVSGDQNKVQIVKWQSKEVAKEISNIALDDMDWLEDTYYVFVQSGSIYKSSFTSTENTRIAAALDSTLQIRLINRNKIFISSDEEEKIITF